MRISDWSSDVCFPISWMAGATIAGLSASVGYYGGPWAELADRAPLCPSLLHFGARDSLIPASLADQMKASHPTLTTHVYEADHGYKLDQRGGADGTRATISQRATPRPLPACLS